MVTYYHAEHEQRSRSLILPDNANEIVEPQTASSSYPAGDSPSKGLPSHTNRNQRGLQIEIPDRQAEPDSEEDSASENFRTIDTEIISGGTKLTKKAKPALTLHIPGIDCNGRLACDAPCFVNQEDMDGPATQPATQPFVDPRRHGHNSLISEQDECDVLCILRPASTRAYQCVQLVAETAPQHILQNHGLSYKLENDEADSDRGSQIPHDEDMLDDVDTEVKPRGSLSADGFDIALRMSSKLKTPGSGFTFGRAPKKCDLLLVGQELYTEETSLISGSHFRIHLNEVGVLMIEDTSTNGLIVDEVLLRAKDEESKDPEVVKKAVKRRMIANGSVIQISLDPKNLNGNINTGKGNINTGKLIRFIVAIPPRHRAGDRYHRKVADYMAYLQQLERLAVVRAQGGVEGAEEDHPHQIPSNPLGNVPKEVGPSRFAATRPLTTMSHYGTEWNGGEKYNIVGKIGQGAFAIVYQLATKKEGELFAAKEIEKRRFMKNGRLDSKVMNEIEIMKTIDHPNIVKFIEDEETAQHFYIIMEFVPCGDLMAYIDSGDAMAEYICQSVAQQICSAVEYLHRSGVTHRDIKPDNILVETRDPMIVKLSDFGLSKRIENEEENLKTFCGTLLYCAPEVYPDYADFKRGVPRKRPRGNDPPAKTVPYKPSVDIWALGAVLYHLLCNQPPWQGSTMFQGQNMLRNIMQTPVDRAKLRNAGVTDVGIEFITSMLRLDPDQRPTELECLQHPWIANRADGKAPDLEMKDVDGPLGAVEEECELDASQLSINENPQHLGIGDSDEDCDTEEIEEIDDQRQSKRVKSHHQPNLETPSGSSSEDDTVPHVSRPGYAGAALNQPQASNTNRLFGEIGESALRSSGVLDYNAHAALEMPFDKRVKATSHGLAQQQHSLKNPQSLPGHLFAGPAPSLLGAEALVGQLNMASLQTGTPTSSPDSISATPDEPKSGSDSQKLASGLSGSKHSHHTFHPSETTTPKRAKKDRSHDVSHSAQHLDDPLARSYESQTSEESHGTEHKGHEVKLGPAIIANVKKTTPNTAGVNAEESSKVNATSSGIESTNHAHVDSGDTSTSTPVANEATFARPPTRLGVLTSMPGSICNATIKLEQRLTFYGRDPSSHVQYADIKDTRVSRNALDIIFWRPGIEAQIANGQNWVEFEDLYAILHTRTRVHVKVNGTKLTRGDCCWNFGRLHTGDVITVFGPAEDEEAEGKAAEFLKFRCEFFVGASAKPRDENSPFVVEKEEEKYMLHQAKRSSQGSPSNSGSQGSENSALGGGKIQTATAKQGVA